MNNAIQQIRSLIQDLPVMVQEVLTLDGSQTAARLSYFPVVGTSVTGYTFTAPSSIDQQSGLLTWASAPLAGSYPVQYQFVQMLDTTIQDILDVQSLDDDDAEPVNILRLAAANALDAIATMIAVIQKKIQLLDLQTDGATVANTMRAHAEILRQQVFSDDYHQHAFDIVEEINDTSGYREKVLKDFLRETP